MPRLIFIVFFSSPFQNNDSFYNLRSPHSQIDDREDDVLCPFVPSSCIATHAECHLIWRHDALFSTKLVWS